MSVKPMREYVNGNCLVCLHADGTKTRTWEGVAAPVFPESVDLKVTDCCDNACAFCHECSTPAGKEADPAAVEDLVRNLPPGVELAIGGGDPLTWEPLEDVAWELRRRGLIPNLTVNQKSISDFGFDSRLQRFKALMPLFYGIGWSGAWESLDIYRIPDDKLVHHLIAGIDAPKDCGFHGDKKVLILGYKQYGRGVKYYSDVVKRNLNHWRYCLPAILSRPGTTSLDNLALEQLGVRGRVDEKVWKRCYMGDDGAFTMYVDAVKMEYAVSSTSPRKPLDGMSIKEAFQALRLEER